MSHERVTTTDDVTVIICRGTGCESSNSEHLHRRLEDEVELQGLADRVQVKKTGCHGFCEQGPIIVIEPENVFYCQVKESDIKEIVEAHLVRGKPVERLFYVSPTTGESIPRYDNIPFYSRQQRVIFRNCGHIDPENIDD